jgi:hypothetical protein
MHLCIIPIVFDNGYLLQIVSNDINVKLKSDSHITVP